MDGDLACANGRYTHGSVDRDYDGCCDCYGTVIIVWIMAIVEIVDIIVEIKIVM